MCLTPLWSGDRPKEQDGTPDLSTRVFDFTGATRLEAREAVSRVLPTDLTGMSVLDLACGEGGHLEPFIERHVAYLTAVDRSPEELSVLRTQYEDRLDHLELVQADVTTWGSAERYHIVHVGDNSLPMLDTRGHQRALLRNMRRHVRADGRVLINLVPLSVRSIIGYGQGYKTIHREQIADTTWLTMGRVKIDLFEGRLQYQFRLASVDKSGGAVTAEDMALSCRLVLRDELEAMISESNLRVIRTDRLPLVSGNSSLYYVCEPDHAGPGFPADPSPQRARM